ncbi:MAG: hypothetical protein ACTSO9_18205 [Candidatus Helarchaeota archaeon]
MAENEEEITDEVWIKFLRKHWKMAILIITGISMAAICGVLLFLWFILPNALSTNLLQKSLSFWTIGYALTFILNVILWEFLFIGIPAIVCAVVIFLLWWKKLPDEEREEYIGDQKKKGRRVSNSGGSGIFSFLVVITWLIIVYTDNNWNTFFAAWSIEYLVYSWISAFLWDLLIFGVPMSIALLLWIRHEMKEKS